MKTNPLPWIKNWFKPVPSVKEALDDFWEIHTKELNDFHGLKHKADTQVRQYAEAEELATKLFGVPIK